MDPQMDFELKGMDFSAVPLSNPIASMQDYTVSLNLKALPKHLGERELRKALSQICCRLDQRSLLPHCSDSLSLRRVKDQLEVKWQDGVKYMDLKDCKILPICNTTAKELAEYFANELVHEFGSKLNGCQRLEVKVLAEPGDSGSFKVDLGESPISKPYQLQDQVLETPTPPVSHAGDESTAEEAFRLLLSTLGIEESSRQELVKTPARAAKAFREMTIGLQVDDPLSVAGDAVFDVDGAHDLVAVREIPFHSLCEHHLLPFAGTAHIAYFPNGRVLGLSKFARLLEVFARRPQLQERLGHQLAEALVKLLSPKGVAVSLEAHHSCMSHRGAGVPSRTRTLALRGPQKDDLCIREQLLSGVSR